MIPVSTKKPVAKEILTGLGRLALPKMSEELEKQARIIREQEPLEQKSLEQKSLEQKSLEQKSLEQEPLEQKSLEQESLEQKSLEQKSLEQESLEQESLEQESLEQESLEQESLEQESLEQESLDKEPFSTKGVSDVDPLCTKGPTVQKTPFGTKGSLVPNAIGSKSSLEQESLEQTSLVPVDQPLGNLTAEEICNAVLRLSSDQAISQAGRIILIYLITKYKNIKVNFTYNQLVDDLAFSQPTISKAIDSLRSNEYLEVISHHRHGTTINCYRLVFRQKSTKETTAPHDNKYSNLLSNKIFNNHERTKETLELVGKLAYILGLKRQDFSISVVRKTLTLPLEDVGCAMVYTLQAKTMSGSPRAGYLYRSLNEEWFKAVDLKQRSTVVETIKEMKRFYSIPIEDYGRNELIGACQLFKRPVSPADSTEELRIFVQKKLEEGRQLSGVLIKHAES